VKPPPHDLEAEAAVVGSMAYWSDTIEPLLGMVEADDFYHPANRLAFELIESEYWQGRRVGLEGVVAHLKAEGHQITPEWRVRLLDGASDATYLKQAEIVAAHRARRDLTAVLDAAQSQLPDYKIHPADVVAGLQGSLERIDRPIGKAPADCLPLGEFLAQDDEKLDPWVVPGLVRRGWRIIVVAAEGAGKSTLFRQFALCAAAGKHPLDLSPIDPVRALLVDLENPPGSVVRALNKLARNLPGLDKERVAVWSRPAGIDIASRTDRRALEGAIFEHRPSLVLIGPLYKAYESEGEHDAQGAAATQRVLDRLRTRYGFGLMLEHHAPHGSGTNRDMRPIGSARWRYWPELGFGLKRKDKDRWHPLVLHRWKPGRDVDGWPTEIDKGATMPWVAKGPDGTYGQGTF
jgi:AAA domain/DnaB-like helicase N terminal domain